MEFPIQWNFARRFAKVIDSHMPGDCEKPRREGCQVASISLTVPPGFLECLGGEVFCDTVIPDPVAEEIVEPG
jgi:hypothetical protein